MTLGDFTLNLTVAEVRNNYECEKCSTTIALSRYVIKLLLIAADIETIG